MPNSSTPGWTRTSVLAFRIRNREGTSNTLRTSSEFPEFPQAVPHRPGQRGSEKHPLYLGLSRFSAIRRAAGPIGRWSGCMPTSCGSGATVWAAWSGRHSQCPCLPSRSNPRHRSPKACSHSSVGSWALVIGFAIMPLGRRLWLSSGSWGPLSCAWLFWQAPDFFAHQNSPLRCGRRGSQAILLRSRRSSRLFGRPMQGRGGSRTACCQRRRLRLRAAASRSPATMGRRSFSRARRCSS